MSNIIWHFKPATDVACYKTSPVAYLFRLSLAETALDALIRLATSISQTSRTNLICWKKHLCSFSTSFGMLRFVQMEKNATWPLGPK